MSWFSGISSFFSSAAGQAVADVAGDIAGDVARRNNIKNSNRGPFVDALVAETGVFLNQYAPSGMTGRDLIEIALTFAGQSWLDCLLC